MSTLKYLDTSSGEWKDGVVDVITKKPVLETLTVKANGSYTPEEGVDGYNQVDVNVPNPSTGNIEITTTSPVDVTDYATAQVVDSDLIASNIKKNVDILGVVGSYEGIIPTGSVTLEKNGTYDVTDYAEAVVTAGTPVDDKIIKFVDEDWNIIAEYTYKEAQALTELPPLPAANTYLTAVDWQLTLDEVKDMASQEYYQERMNYIAPVYHPTMGADATHIFVTFENEKASKDAAIMISRTSNTASATYTINWGDGSATETYTFGTSSSSNYYNFSNHTYAPDTYPASYVITIRITKDASSVITLGGTVWGSTNVSLLGYSDSSGSDPLGLKEQRQRQLFSNNITKVIIGCKWKGSSKALYHFDNECKVIICGDKDSSSTYYNNSSVGNDLNSSSSWIVRYLPVVKNFYFISNATYGPTQISKTQKVAWLTDTAITYYYNLVDYIPYKSLIGDYSFNKEVYTFPNSITTFSISHSSWSPATAILPNSITTVRTLTTGARVTFDFTQLDHVPTMTYDNSFYILSNRVIVPDALYDEWISATNWSAIADYIYKESEVES